jgi:hypothetical protein
MVLEITFSMIITKIHYIYIFSHLSRACTWMCIQYFLKKKLYTKCNHKEMRICISQIFIYKLNLVITRKILTTSKISDYIRKKKQEKKKIVFL